MADPRQRTLTEHRPGREPRVYGEEDVLEVPDIIPGFSASVRDLLAD